MKYTVPVLVICILLTTTISTAQSQVATRYGYGLTTGNTYDPDSDYTWVQADLLALFDYDTIWPHRAPEPLRFKVETHLGATVRDDFRGIHSINILAHYYLDTLAGNRWRPFVEAGIGLIYTDFQIKEQGLRINFNPQAGFGSDYSSPFGGDWYVSLRAHHISNGGLDDDNRGINSVTLSIGRYFDTPKE